MNMPVQKTRSNVLALRVYDNGIFSDAMLRVPDQGDSSARNGNVRMRQYLPRADVDQPGI